MRIESASKELPGDVRARCAGGILVGLSHRLRDSLAASVLVCSAIAALLLVVATAQAYTVHPYLSTPHMTEVPEASGATYPGPITEVGSMTTDEGHLWTGEHIGGTLNHRIDEFSDSSGAFMLQLADEVGPLAVGHVGGEAQLYVGKGVAVGVFSASTGASLGEWTGAGVTSIERFGGVSAIAADSSRALGDWASGDVYVADAGEKVVDVFRPKAGGGEEYVTRLPGTFTEPRFVAVSASTGEVFVVDEPSTYEGTVIDAFEPEPNMEGVYKERTITEETGVRGESLGAFGRIEGFAIDGAEGGLYIVERRPPDYRSVVTELGLTGEVAGQIGATSSEPFHAVTAVAADQASGHLFVADYNEAADRTPIDAFGPGMVAPDLSTSAASAERLAGEGRIEVTLNGEVDPLEAGPATCEFAWGSAGELSSTIQCAAEVHNGSTFQPVQATLTDLEPDTTYCYRLRASNAAAANPGEGEQCFTTSGPGGLTNEWATDVRSTSATLNGTVDPHGRPTSWYVQYGHSTGYGSESPSSAQATPLGSGEQALSVEQHIQDLAAGTMYHYRLVAVSELAGGVTEAFYGPDRTFTTHSAGAPLALPDGRAWELLSATELRGTVYGSLQKGGNAIHAAADGTAFTDAAANPTEEAAPGISELEQVLFTRTATGWRSRDISLPHAAAEDNVVEVATGNGEYALFSSDLSRGLAEPRGPFTPLGEAAFPPATERTPYLVDDEKCAEGGTPTGCYTPLLTGAEGYADVYEPQSTKFGGGSEAVVGEGVVTGAGPDLRHVVISSGVALTRTPLSQDGLYEWSANQPPTQALQIVSLLPSAPGEEPLAAPEASLGGWAGRARVERAISTDGSRVVWDTGGSGDTGTPLYMRDVNKQETVELDLPTTGSGRPTPGENGTFYETASSDDSKVFFLGSAELIEGKSSPTGSDLYVCEMHEEGGHLKCALSDLTPQVEGRSSEVLGTVLGSSEDGAYVYFVAAGVLSSAPSPTGEHARVGADNLYLMHRGAAGWEPARLIAVLTGEDHSDWTGDSHQYGPLTARVSPDGHYVTFASVRSLTGFDNHDASRGEPDAEVFLYHAQTSAGGALEAGALICASCNPSGERPSGGASIPATNSFRYLLDNGRVFFDSKDALVPKDINGVQDVYQYEPDGVGSCTSRSSTFSASATGCIDLISSGSSAEESSFLDASETGADVFFLTAENLVPQDLGTGVDIYDAHECSVAAPCTSALPQPPQCSTADACRAAPEPQPALYGAPASATFSGKGNLSTGPKSAPSRSARRKARRCHRGKRRSHRRCVRRRRRAKARKARKSTGNRGRMGR